VENIGVRPEIQADYMTRDNLTQNGKPFVDTFSRHGQRHPEESRE
jgi:hypothetical protein